MDYIKQLLTLRATSLDTAQITLTTGILVLGTVAFVNDNAVAISNGINILVIPFDKIVSVA
ncbi:hypothetical protein [Paenibacillus sp. OV219]|uniref:hypothetical protein n=1 Tax=Paenibacillus sp. OV219 TaxID=1884377 RepID=UPI0008D4E367|nr:hypothetical protein [Paenibacillus sp. OV219]SEN94386.1 hypothetical protein SAMN05518847_10520 [Paenibacillus sp. OV219]